MADAGTATTGAAGAATGDATAAGWAVETIASTEDDVDCESVAECETCFLAVMADPSGDEWTEDEVS